MNPQDMVNDEDKLLISQIVDVVDTLRKMDGERIRNILYVVNMAKPIFPKEMLPALESLEIDFTLAVAFIEQAKQYDRSKDALAIAERLFGKEVTNE